MRTDTGGRRPHVARAVTALCVVIYALTLLTRGAVLDALFFDPLLIADEYQFWRLLTPSFIHFGLLHIAFNLAIFGFLAGAVEKFRGHLFLILLTAATGAAGNVCQYFFTGSVFFGGLSGVVMGLTGYGSAVSLCPKSPRALKLAMSLLAVNILFGVFEYFADGGIAVYAHGAGLLAGLAFGAADYLRLMRAYGLRQGFSGIVAEIRSNLRPARR